MTIPLLKSTYPINQLLEVQRKIKTANNSIKDLNMDRQRLTKRIREIEDRYVMFTKCTNVIVMLL